MSFQPPPGDAVVPIYTRLVVGRDYRALSPAAKLVLLSCKLMLGPSGIAAVPAHASVLSECTGYDVEAIDDALTELSEDGWVRCDPPVLWVVRGLEFQPDMSPTDPSDREVVHRAISALPRSNLIQAYHQRYEEWFTAPSTSTTTTKQRKRDAKNTDELITRVEGKEEGKEVKEVSNNYIDVLPSSYSPAPASVSVGLLHDLLPGSTSELLVQRHYPRLAVLVQGNEPALRALMSVMGRCQRPALMLAELEAVVGGQRPNIPGPVTVEGLTMALTDLEVVGGRITPLALRAFVRRAMSEHQTPAQPAHGRARPGGDPFADYAETHSE